MLGPHLTQLQGEWSLLDRGLQRPQQAPLRFLEWSQPVAVCVATLQDPEVNHSKSTQQSKGGHQGLQSPS